MELGALWTRQVDFLLSLAFAFVIIESIRGVHGLVRSILERFFTPHYRVQFHPMLDRTSFLEGKNRSTLGADNLSGLVQFVRLYGLDSYVVECKKEEKNGWWEPENLRLRGKHY